MKKSRAAMSVVALALVLSSGFMVGGQGSTVYAKAATPGLDAATQAWDRTSMDKDLQRIISRSSSKLLGAYVTGMFTSTDNRISNVKKAAKRINGEVIGPNETFSFNETVGNSNLPEDGWKKAGVFIGGKLVDDYGGGICQVSSTLFNAAEEAGMVMVERHAHSRDISYVPKGRDATVAYGALDFKFANPYDYPVKIKAKVYDDTYVLVRIVRA